MKTEENKSRVHIEIRKEGSDEYETKTIFYHDLYSNKSSVYSKEYKLNDSFHRDPSEGPAVVSFYPDGKKKIVEYCVRGVLHRNPNEGPAAEYYDEYGVLLSSQYCVNGRIVPRPYIKDERFETRNKTIIIDGVEYYLVPK